MYVTIWSRGCGKHISMCHSLTSHTHPEYTLRTQTTLCWFLHFKIKVKLICLDLEVKLQSFKSKNQKDSFHWIQKSQWKYLRTFHMWDGDAVEDHTFHTAKSRRQHGPIWVLHLSSKNHVNSWIFPTYKVHRHNIVSRSCGACLHYANVDL